MLRLLRVRQLAIADEIELELGDGLNIVTGETGAGKSILVDALQLVLGARASPELVRSGAERAEVEALFELSPEDRERLAGREVGEELVLRRVVEAAGRSRAYVDGRLATVAELGEVARGLCDISSQHEHHSLVDPQGHLGYLDDFAHLGPERAQMERAWALLRDAEAAFDSLRAQLREDRADWLRFQLAELDRVAELDVDEGELSRLRNVEQLAALATRAHQRLYADDGAACATVSRALADVEAASRLDPGVEGLRERLVTVAAELDDLAAELGRYARTQRADPARLAALEEAQHELRRLRRKHGDDLAGARARLGAELGTFERAITALASAEAAIEAARAEVGRVAPRLSARRREEAERLARGITAELGSLGMGEARVNVDVSHAGLGPRGADRVEFLIATNRGEEPRPLRKVASGGELSRALLAVKRVLAATGPVGTYVFDEVDSGVGGAVGEVIGRKLFDVSRHHQVVCITHLPQIAAWGDRHLHVRKSVAGDRTVSSVHRLGEPETVEELARMLGGVRVSDAARAAARELRAGRLGG